MRRAMLTAAVALAAIVPVAAPAFAAPPTADSGPSVVVNVAAVAQLSGSVFDPDGDALEIRWIRSVVSGGSLASCTFSGPTAFESVSPAGLAPTLSCTQPGEYLLQLAVADGTSTFDSVGALVTFTPNHPPVADSGPSVNAVAGTDAQLNGTASDPDGDAQEIRWLRSVVSGGDLSSCTFSGPTAFQPVSAAGLAPTLNCTQPGEYLMQLIVGDGQLSDDDIGALVTFTAPLDLTSAVCGLVSQDAGGLVVRLSDPESGVAGYTSAGHFNMVGSPASATFSSPQRSAEVQLTRVTRRLAGVAIISHTNGASVQGSCLVVIRRNGAGTVHNL